MKLAGYFRGPLHRAIKRRLLGPNEARLLYDGATGFLALAISVGFSSAFLPAIFHSKRDFFLIFLPFLGILCNATFGVYSRIRVATGCKKAAVLLLAQGCCCILAWSLTDDPAPVVLWGVIAYGAMAMARLLLNLPYSKHQQLAAIAVNRRGPVVVVGGAGYIGSYTVELLLRAGRRVRVLDKFMYGRESLAEFANHPNLEVIDGDSTDIMRLTAALKGASAVIHLAGLVGDPACAVNTDFTRHANIVATRMVKQVAQSLGVHRFIFASSCSVYGVSDKEVSETSALNPISLYAQTKIDSEKELLFDNRNDFLVTILRFATVFGHSRRPRFDLVGNLFTAQALTDGLITVIAPHHWRPFIHVRDLARAVVIVLNADPVTVENQIFNVGDKCLNLTILQLAEIVQKVTSKYRRVSLSVTDDIRECRNYAVSFGKIRSSLGYEASVKVESGIEEMAAKFAQGKYGDYRSDIYCNVAMTAKALSHFQDPAESANLYGPLSFGSAAMTVTRF